jgi:ubiquinone/menaquinone biosynthesis C-methylase UbiE
MFLKRSFQRELMDDFYIEDKRIDEALNELKIINKFLGGINLTKHGLNRISKKYPSLEKPIKILDVGGGASDNLTSIKKQDHKIFSADMNKRINSYLKHSSKNVEIICADAFNLPFNGKAFDIVHLSLFLHHYNEVDIKTILEKCISLAKYGIIINDLRRSIFALAGIKLLTTFFSKSEFVKNDAPLSVKKSFAKNELVTILNELNLNYHIQRGWAFRWLVIIYINDKK